MHKVFTFGSGESDQLPLGRFYEGAKKATLIKYFEENKINIVKIACGGAHGLGLTDDGKVYSWGMNDEFPLGRDINPDDEKEQYLPGKVDIPEKVDGITAGETHSIAYSKSSNNIYFFGLYRDHAGPFGER